MESAAKREQLFMMVVATITKKKDLGRVILSVCLLDNHSAKYPH
jgi:hypothetical protein